MATQRGTLFPALERPLDMRDLVGLKITEVTASLVDSVRVIHCEDAKGETHEITFHTVDASYTAILLDGHEVLNINTEV
jgi:hypothetical protein